MEEYLDVFNDAFEHIGTAPRSQVHQKGLLHRVAHCWIIGKKQPVLYFQQRAQDKKDFPNYYDIACGGHISAGEQVLPAMIREIWEELGLTVEPSQLISLGNYRVPDLKLPHFYDRAMASVYVMHIDIPHFAPGEEVSRMICVKIADFCRMELKQAAEIPVQDMDGNTFFIKKEQWCCHDGAFETIVLPYIRSIFPADTDRND